MKRLLLRLKKIFIVLFITQLAYVIILRWVNPPITLTQLSSVIDGYGLKCEYVNWEDISVHAKLAVIAAEDQLFADHNGFDWKSIEQVLKQKNSKKKRLRGASTISQQVAKNVFLWQGRSWIRKGLEVYFTFMIEIFWGKQRILEVYLNVAETGKGIFGIETAAKNYFKKSARKLSAREAALIAACLPNPKKYTVKPVSPYAERKHRWILQQMNNLRGDESIEALLSPANSIKHR
jgi:monofunctional biosynthetic peptidoglycan transglycosylase